MPSYNQGAFIAEAIESVLLQECDFVFKLLIFDDASTDNSIEICNDFVRRYPAKIQLFSNDTNLGLIKNYIKAFNACSAKYIAILEADDYWVDRQKLTKQVAVLEENSNVGLVHARPKVLSNNGFRVDYNVKGNDNQGIKLFEDLLLGKYSISPLTVMFRRDLLFEIDFEICVSQKFQTIDLFLWLDFVLRTNIYFLNDVVGVYRYLNNSVSNTYNFEKRDSFIKSSIAIVDYYINKYSVTESSVKLIKNKQQAILLHNAFIFNNKSKIKEYFFSLKCSDIDSTFLFLFACHPVFNNLYHSRRKLLRLLSTIKQKFNQIVSYQDGI